MSVWVVFVLVPVVACLVPGGYQYFFWLCCFADLVLDCFQWFFLVPVGILLVTGGFQWFWCFWGGRMTSPCDQQVAE